VLPDILPLDPDPPEISDEDWAARLASRMRGAYQAAARLLRNIKDPKTRERFQKRQSPPPLLPPDFIFIIYCLERIVL
jgi:hypothetical protein